MGSFVVECPRMKVPKIQGDVFKILCGRQAVSAADCTACRASNFGLVKEDD
jgi:hypothetical protein